MGKCIDSIESGNNQMTMSTNIEKTVCMFGKSGTLNFTLMKSDLRDAVMINPSLSYPAYCQVEENVGYVCVDLHVRISYKLDEYDYTSRSI